MNERIRELAKESDLDWHKHWNDDESNRVEKFAELIVREFFKYIEDEEDRLWNMSLKEHDPHFQSNFEICADKCRDIVQGLKDHFGVEE